MHHQSKERNMSKSQKKKKNYILSRKKTSFFEKLNQTHSILLQFTQDLHLLTAYHQTKTLISRFFLLMPPLLRNGSFIFLLQSKPFYQAQLVPVTTISTREAQLKVSHFTNATCTYDDHFHLGSLGRLELEGEAVCLSRAVHRRSLKRGLVYEEWIHFLTKKRLYTWMNENEEISQVVGAP